jgi:hypothetical protein
MPYEPVLATFDRRLLLGVACIAALPVVAAVLFTLALHLTWRNAVRSRVPAAFKPGYLYTGDAGSSLGLVRFSISTTSADAMQTRGMAYLKRETGLEWASTPQPIKRFRPFASCGGFWCSRSAVAAEAKQWVAQPGSFAWVSTELNDQRAILVNPAKKAVILGYYVD